MGTPKRRMKKIQEDGSKSSNDQRSSSYHDFTSWLTEFEEYAKNCSESRPSLDSCMMQELPELSDSDSGLNSSNYSLSSVDELVFTPSIDELDKVSKKVSIPFCITMNGVVMIDFVIINTDEDLEKATECKEAIIEDLKEEGATVHLFSEIGHGKTTLQSIQSLHGKYRYILVYVGESLVHDKQYKFLIEMLIMEGLNGKENKDYRVVPIFTKKCSSGNLELDIIKGINYYQRNTSYRAYLRGLQTLLNLARERFPC